MHTQTLVCDAVCALLGGVSSWVAAYGVCNGGSACDFRCFFLVWQCVLGIAANSAHNWATVKTLADASGTEAHFSYGLYKVCGGSSLTYEWGDCCSKSTWLCVSRGGVFAFVIVPFVGGAVRALPP